MAVSWRKHHRPSLETQLWRVLTVDGRDWLVKSLFKEDSYELLLSDLSTVWEESLEARAVARRAKSLNPNVEAPLSVLLSHLSSHLDSPPSSSSFTLHHHPPTLTLSLSSTLSSLPLQWEFHCTSASPDTLGAHLVLPLFSMVSELARRQQELVRVLGRKDREIKDYRDSGAQVSRRHLETTPFDEKAFTNEMTLSQDFERGVQLPLKALESGQCQELYRNTTMARAWAGRKEELPPMEEALGDASTTGTWAGKIPASLLPSHPLPSSPTRSPIKRPVEESPSKEDEKSRREALERRLEDDKLKGKKKKKKLM